MKELVTLRSLIDGLAEHRDRPAVLALRKKDMERWSFAQLADHVQRLAQSLRETGVGKGIPVGLLATPRPEWMAACLAAIDAAAVVVPLDVQLSDDVLRHVLTDSGCRVLFSEEKTAMTELGFSQTTDNERDRHSTVFLMNPSEVAGGDA